MTTPYPITTALCSPRRSRPRPRPGLAAPTFASSVVLAGLTAQAWPLHSLRVSVCGGGVGLSPCLLVLLDPTLTNWALGFCTGTLDHWAGGQPKSTSWSRKRQEQGKESDISKFHIFNSGV